MYLTSRYPTIPLQLLHLAAQYIFSVISGLVAGETSGAYRHYQFLICSPASPPCLDSGLPTHITRQSTVLEVGSSKISSTDCPRLRQDAPTILKPSCELSRTRHGILCACSPCLTIRLARFFRAVRLNRRRSGMARLGTTQILTLNRRVQG